MIRTQVFLITQKAEDNKPVWQWAYSGFGNNKPVGVLQAQANPDHAASKPALEFDLRFPGQIADSETGLFYNFFRNYQPSQGRYTQGDPIGLDGGVNRFSYVGGNPLGVSDPTGLTAMPSVPAPMPGSNMSLAPWATPEACQAEEPRTQILAANTSEAKRKTYCLAFCQYELDMPGRFDNFGPHRACMRRCMGAGGFTM